MNFIKKHFSMYSGLPKEVYILSFGRIMTSMGALIWPMLTLIMRNKLGMSASDIGLYMMIISIIMVPCSLLGGKLADKYNKKHIIVGFDLISNSLYILCAIFEISTITLVLMTIASILQFMESPSFDALLVDLTPFEKRERAYSLMYFAMNLGLVLAPTIGGILFNSHLNLAFLINGLCDLSSTLLILFFIKNIKHNEKETIVNEYENAQEGSILKVLLSHKSLIIFFIISAIGSMLYAQFNFLVPLHLDSVYMADGAFKFGILTSVNALVVVIGTPIITKEFENLADTKLMFIGQALEIIGLVSFAFLNHYIVAILAVIILTIGEIFKAISSNPHFSKRIPLSHRGRMLGLLNIFVSLVGTIFNYIVGILIDTYSFNIVWMIMAIIGTILLLIFVRYIKLDKKAYSKLY